MRCPRCEAFSNRNGNFCGNCGLALSNWRALPVKRNANLPVVSRRAAPSPLVQGVAVLAVGALAQLALRSLVKEAVGILPSLFSMTKPAARARQLPVKGNRGYLPEPEDTYAISETVVMRRLILRR